jgi:hypothetical protein
VRKLRENNTVGIECITAVTHGTCLQETRIPKRILLDYGRDLFYLKEVY